MYCLFINRFMCCVLGNLKYARQSISALCFDEDKEVYIFTIESFLDMIYSSFLSFDSSFFSFFAFFSF
jgi:hypothetical protein